MNVLVNETSVDNRRCGCDCKKSSCLKLYCKCFAANDRCSKRCQCKDCKNQDHNQQEISQDIQAIEKCTQKTFCSSLQAPRASESEPVAEPSQQTPPSSTTSIVTPVTFSTNVKSSMAMTITSPKPVCACVDGNCIADCPCLSLFGACSPRCQCNGCLVVQIQPERTKGCSCKKSNCLKLYCECLAAQRMCDHRCNCKGCKNRPDTLPERNHAIAVILERNPLAFEPKIASGSSQHLRGCHCRKSGCMKNYCECHQAGVACTSRCACHQCRNTETFVSAKKMLVFAGVSTDDSSLRATLNRSLQRKIIKRPSRGAKKANPQDELQTPSNASTQKPTALELLSRSAPVAPSKSSRQRNTAIDDNSPTTPSKRPSNYPDRFHTDGECVVKPAFAKRKYTRRNRHKTSFMERIQEAAAPVKELPNVEDTVANAYDTKNIEGVGDAELIILSRSLLHAAVAVQLANEENKASAAPLRQLPVEQQVQRVFEAERQRSSDLTDGREALSPIAAGLFCEEEYSEADDNNYLDVATSAINENDTASGSTTVEQSNMRSQQNGKNASLSVLQERAVLQELSVWLRNMTADVSSR